MVYHKQGFNTDPKVPKMMVFMQDVLEELIKTRQVDDVFTDFFKTFLRNLNDGTAVVSFRGH